MAGWQLPFQPLDQYQIILLGDRKHHCNEIVNYVAICWDHMDCLLWFTDQLRTLRCLTSQRSGNRHLAVAECPLALDYTCL